MLRRSLELVKLAHTLRLAVLSNTYDSTVIPPVDDNQLPALDRPMELSHVAQMSPRNAHP